MTNICGVKTQFLVRDSEHFPGKLQRYAQLVNCDGKIYRPMFMNTSVLSWLHTNMFSIIQALQDGFQVMSELKSLVLKKKWRQSYLKRKSQGPVEMDFLLQYDYTRPKRLWYYPLQGSESGSKGNLYSINCGYHREV